MRGNVATIFQPAPSVVVRAPKFHWYRTVTNPETALLFLLADELRGDPAVDCDADEQKGRRSAS